MLLAHVTTETVINYTLHNYAKNLFMYKILKILVKTSDRVAHFFLNVHLRGLLLAMESGREVWDLEPSGEMRSSISIIHH